MAQTLWDDVHGQPQEEAERVKKVKILQELLAKIDFLPTPDDSASVGPINREEIYERHESKFLSHE